MYNKNNIHPRIEPCGTPFFIYFNAETCFPWFVFCYHYSLFQQLASDVLNMIKTTSQQCHQLKVNLIYQVEYLIQCHDL
jgi:hypothetical protein